MPAAPPAAASCRIGQTAPFAKLTGWARLPARAKLVRPTPLFCCMSPNETVSNLRGGMARPKTVGRGNGMKWRVMVELTGSDGPVCAHEVSVGVSNTAECSAATVGLTLADGKRTLAGLRDHLVQSQTEECCRQRRRCSHCGSQRPLKDVRARRLLSVFGTVEVRAPRFSPLPGPLAASARKFTVRA